MSTEALQRAFDSTRSILENVKPNQMDNIDRIKQGKRPFASADECGNQHG